MNTKKVDDLLLKDDILFNVVFRDDKQLSKEFIEILESNSISNDFVLIMQDNINQNLSKKSVLDMKVLTDKKCVVVEMQQNKSGFPPERANLILSTVYANIIKPNTKYEEYHYLHLHVICAYKPFKSDEYKNGVKKFLETDFDEEFDDKVRLYYHDITSNNLPNNLYGDLCRYINTGILTQHEFIIKVDEKVKLIKNREDTKMELHGALGTIHKYEYVARLEGKAEGIEEGKAEGVELQKQESLRNILKTFKKMGVSRSEACILAKDTINLSKSDINKAVDEIYN